MELWVLITIAAAFLQNLRSALQKHLKNRLSTTGATFVRFGFGLPFAFAYVALLHFLFGYAVPQAQMTFAVWTLVGALCQIAATFLLIHLFSFRNFVVGTAYSRTEPVHAAIFGLLFLGDRASPGAVFAIVITIVGVMLISVARSAVNAKSLITSLFTRIAGLGILSGIFFGLSGVAYRAASLSLGEPGFAMQAAFTLTVAIAIQTVVMLGWIVWRERDQLAKMAAAWKPSLATGFVGATASFGWFAAFTLQQAALVKAVAQIEIVFTILSSLLFFREHVNMRELAGTGLIVLGIVALLFLG